MKYFLVIIDLRSDLCIRLYFCVMKIRQQHSKKKHFNKLNINDLYDHVHDRQHAPIQPNRYENGIRPYASCSSNLVNTIPSKKRITNAVRILYEHGISDTH